MIRVLFGMKIGLSQIVALFMKDLEFCQYEGEGKTYCHDFSRLFSRKAPIKNHCWTFLKKILSSNIPVCETPIPAETVEVPDKGVMQLTRASKNC